MALRPVHYGLAMNAPRVACSQVGPATAEDDADVVSAFESREILEPFSLPFLTAEPVDNSILWVRLCATLSAASAAVALVMALGGCASTGQGGSGTFGSDAQAPGSEGG